MRGFLPIFLVLGSALVVFVLIRGPAGSGLPAVGDDLPMPPETVHPDPAGVEVSVVAEGLEVIWSMEAASDGRLFVTERPGRIRVVSADGELEAEPWGQPRDLHHEGEGGLMGLALHPRFPDEPWVYVMYTARTREGLVNRVSRFREVDGSAGEEEVLLDDLPAGNHHNGGRIRFGPDGHLYVALGDVGRRERAQDPSDPAGSILRIDSEGAVPPDNPHPGERVFAHGLRNVQGLAFHPETGALFAADHGPSVEWRVPLIRHRDEINLVRSGGNYGWPRAVGAPGVEGLTDPLLLFIPAAPPGDLLFGPRSGRDLFFSTLRSETLMRIRFEADDPHRPTAIERWFTDEDGTSVLGRLRALAAGRDGSLLVGTSNRDGRGTLREGDDRILRLDLP